MSEKEKVQRFSDGFMILEALPYWSDIFPNDNTPYQFVARLMGEHPSFSKEEIASLAGRIQNINKARAAALGNTIDITVDDGGILQAAEYVITALHSMIVSDGSKSTGTVATLCKKAHESAKRAPRFAFSN